MHTETDTLLLRARDVTPTFLVAADLVRAVVLTVVEVVTAQVGADAAAVGALELILLTDWGGLWRYRGHYVKSITIQSTPEHSTTRNKLTAVDLITVVPTVVNTVTTPG